MIFFSVYKSNSASRIVTTDLAGRNATVLLHYPQVFDVTGLTIDYTDDRLVIQTKNININVVGRTEILFFICLNRRCGMFEM